MAAPGLGRYAAHCTHPDRSAESGYCAGGGDGAHVRAKRGTRSFPLHGWREELEESFVQGQHDGSDRSVFRTGESESRVRDAVARDLEARAKGSVDWAGERALQIERRGAHLDTNSGWWTTDRGLGAVRRNRDAGNARAARVFDCRGERKKRWALPFGRWRSNVEKDDGRPADHRILVYERDSCRSEESGRGLCADAKFVPFHGRREEFYGDQWRAGRR